MPFKVKDCYLRNATYSAPLDRDLFIASFIGKLLLGTLTTSEESQEPQFSAKSVIVPQEKLYNFVEVVSKAKEAYQQENKTPFRVVIDKPLTHYELIGVFDQYDDHWNFQLRYLWKHAQDRRFREKVEMGLADPIQSDEDYLFLSRGVVLDQDQVEMVNSQMKMILERSFYEPAPTRLFIDDFVKHVTKPEYGHREYIAEQLEKYAKLTYNEKLNILQTLLVRMCKDQGKSAVEVQIKTYLDTFKNKLSLVFSLMKHMIDN